MNPDELDLDAAGSVLIEPPTTDEAIAAAGVVIRHSRSGAEAETLMEMLGLNVPLTRFSCPRCTYPLGSVGHTVTCEPQATAARVTALAARIGSRR